MVLNQKKKKTTAQLSNKSEGFTRKLSYRISSDHIISSLEYFPQQKFSLLGKKLKYCGNFMNWLQFQNSKKNSFSGNFMRKYGMLILSLFSEKS